MSLEDRLAENTAALTALTAMLAKSGNVALPAVAPAAPATAPAASSAPAEAGTTRRRRRTQAEIAADAAAASKPADPIVVAATAGPTPTSKVTNDEITQVFLDFMNYGDDDNPEHEKIREVRQDDVVDMLQAIGVAKASLIPQEHRRKALDWIERLTEDSDLEIDFAADLKASSAPPTARRAANSLV